MAVDVDVVGEDADPQLRTLCGGAEPCLQPDGEQGDRDARIELAKQQLGDRDLGPDDRRDVRSDHRRDGRSDHRRDVRSDHRWDVRSDYRRDVWSGRGTDDRTDARHDGSDGSRSDRGSAGRTGRGRDLGGSSELCRQQVMQVR